MQTTTCAAILAEQMTALWRQADGNVAPRLLPTPRHSVAISRGLTDGEDLDIWCVRA